MAHFSDYQVFFKAKTPNLCIILSFSRRKQNMWGLFCLQKSRGLQIAVGGGKKEAYLFLSIQPIKTIAGGTQVRFVIAYSITTHTHTHSLSLYYPLSMLLNKQKDASLMRGTDIVIRYKLDI